ncbi:MAG: type II CAAX prenyl endopeptidase Rce1 family protein [Phycisphaerales bacterium]
MPRASTPWRVGHRPIPRSRAALGGERYASASVKPLYVLAVVLPLIVLYEIGSGMYLARAGGQVETIRAHSLLLSFFRDFGVVGRAVPSCVIVATLLSWHVMSGARWRIKPAVLGGMVLEAAAWTVPLLVLIALVLMLGRASAPAAIGPAWGTMPTAAGGVDLAAFPWQARATISIGAGLYEEFLFRLVGLTLCHAILLDLLRLPNSWATPMSIVAAGIAFALYHDVAAGGGHVRWAELVALGVAGVFFGVVFVYRGFGIVAMVHALYDIWVLIGLDRG